MPEPYNYNIQMPDIGKSVMAGFDFGQSFGLREEARLKAAEEAQKKAEMEADLAELSENPTADGILKASLKYPQLSEQFKRSNEMLGPIEQKAALGRAMPVYNALLAGDVDTAKATLLEQVTALRNSGKEKEAGTAEAMLKMIDINPSMLTIPAGMYLANALGPEKYAENFGKLGEERRKEAMVPGEMDKMGAELGLTKAQTNKVIMETKKLGVEISKLALEAEAFKATGGIDPEKKFDLEDKVRKEYNARTKGLADAQQSYAIIGASANDHSGAGDIALVTAFMKMLDPGSVVRETEFANARDTAGLMAQLKNKAQKLQTGAFLDPKQRNDFKRLADEYMKAAQAHGAKVRTGLEKVVKNYNLTAENVFGTGQRIEEADL